MASLSPAGIHDFWAELKQNPVFRRSVVPRGARFLVHSPFPRVLLLTAVALAACEASTRLLLRMPVAGYFTLAVVFWFLIQAMQRYFCWMELSALARTGTLDDYLNTGLKREDVAIGVIYPAVIAEIMAVTLVLVYFMTTTENRTIQIVLLVFAIMSVMRLFHQPFLFMPDLESYLRKRNPLSLFFISISVLVPLVIWFAIFFGAFYAFLFIAPLAGFTVTFEMAYIVPLAFTYIVSRYPIRWWEGWRLRRFYQRYSCFDELFEKYIEQGEMEAR